jgi:hypothetical protein
MFKTAVISFATSRFQSRVKYLLIKHDLNKIIENEEKESKSPDKNMLKRRVNKSH